MNITIERTRVVYNHNDSEETNREKYTALQYFLLGLISSDETADAQECLPVPGAIHDDKATYFTLRRIFVGIYFTAEIPKYVRSTCNDDIDKDNLEDSSRCPHHRNVQYRGETP